MKRLNDDDPFAALRPVADAKVVPIREDIWPPTPPVEAYANEFMEPPQKPVAPLSATPFVWVDPKSIPPRPWVYGHHMIRKQVSVTVAPGGVGKSSLTLVEALALVTGRELLDEWVGRSPLRVWVYNLEDPRDEMQRRVTAAMMHHGVTFKDICDEDGVSRLYVDSGRDRPLCTAVEIRGEVSIVRPEIEALADEITGRGIDVLIVDPFVSSHRVSENAAGAIDLVAKEWARLADRCNCAIELVHHTRKTGGADATTEDGRGSKALVDASRSARVLNRMDAETRAQAGVADDPATIFGIDRDKANLAPAGARRWIRMAEVALGQGDKVGVAEVWKWPDAFDGITVRHLIDAQKETARRWEAGNPPRLSDKSGAEWIGCLVGEICGLSVEHDKSKIKTILKSWMDTGSLVKTEWTDETRRKRPVIEVGEWAFE